ncbi:RNA-binding protein YlmH, contains S4-like domain [Clostridium amylolyticum]|uniref:RNA-binding protein YlmH, contains S4-like domain n=1 Tax=Clostridium amylolyticum TaxID=1121298 RepID=A0A1M6KK28_9CLOT|nr:YlmH/Sll1252 family protein [Clostridium amylolyticum]SHJ59305.1 RNA-binding protein YlmH, contains S4-like domain [Clostridium amylolyticum]
MIIKENFIKIFPFKAEEDIISRIYEKFLISEKTNNISPLRIFLTPQYWHSLEKYCVNNNVPYIAEGFFQEAERRIFIFNYEKGEKIPAVVLRITNKSKFKTLNHRDYLGALLSLGIERDVIGDIIVDNDKAYVAVVEDISDYLLYNLETVGKNPCKVELLDDLTVLPKVNKKSMDIIVTSRRLDNFLSSMCNISRSEAIRLIDQGKVLVDYMETREKSEFIKSNSTITVRGYGKFYIEDTIKNTKSDRQVVKIQKYI